MGIIHRTVLLWPCSWQSYPYWIMYKGIEALSHMYVHHFSLSPRIIDMLQIICNINATVGTGRPVQVYPRRLNHHHHQYGDDDHGDHGPPYYIW